MRSVTLSIVITSALVSAGCVAAPETMLQNGGGKHLFILSGQSNMAGLNPHVSFTPAVAEAFGSANIIVVKDAASGASIRSGCKRNLEDPPPTVGRIPKVRGECYGRLITRVNAAIAGQSVRTVTFVWAQGESDLRNPEHHAYLPELIHQLQDDLGRKDINVVIGRISDCGLDREKRLAGRKYIRRTQVDFAQSYPRGARVATDDLNDREVNGNIIRELHYTADGYKVLGEPSLLEFRFFA